LIDRELYTPVSWTDDRERCRAAGIGDEVPFATKTEHFKWMLQRAIDARVPFARVTADEAYGQVKHMRAWLEERHVAYVPATKVKDAVPTTGGTDAEIRDLVTAVPRQAWKRISAGAGAHGQRFYDWARIAIRPVWEDGLGHWVLARRSISDLTEIACYVCYGPVTSRLKDLVRTAGARWQVEECFQIAKGECGLDHYQVRLYRVWYRHITLAMAALAYLTATRVTEAAKGQRRRRAGPRTPQRPGDSPDDRARRHHAPLRHQRAPSALVTLPTPRPSPSPPLPTPRPRPPHAVAVIGRDGWQGKAAATTWPVR
jgi:SRSO17 transposase